MTVRLKLALTIFATGLVTALLVVATVVYSFQRFENETAYRRGMAFLARVVSMYDNIFDMHERSPEEFQRWLRGLVLFEPDTELYLLDNDGTVLAKTGPAVLPPGFRVALGPVRESIERMDTSYVMGDDPERMDAGAVIVAKPVQRAIRRDASANAGYLYLVLHTQQLPEGRWDVLRSSFARPVMGLVVAVVAFTTLLALLIISAVTQPLKQLTQALATLSQRGLAEGLTIAPTSPLPAPTKDEFGQLTSAFEMLLDVCRRQWNALRRTDHFRREGVSNLSHDLRSPLTATVACLERFEAGDRRGERRTQVVREIAHAFAAEVVGAAQRVPLPAADIEKHLEGARQLPELVLRRRRQGTRRRDRQAFGEAALRKRRQRLRQLLERLRHRRDDEQRQQGRESDDSDDEAHHWPREARAQDVPATFGQLLRVQHEVEIAGVGRCVAPDRTLHRLGDDDGPGIHALGVVAHHVRGIHALDRFAHRPEGDTKARRENRRPGLGEHRAVVVEQVQLGIRLEQDEPAQPALELFGAALVHVENVVVHADDAAEKRHAAPIGRFVLEALERIDDGGDDEEGRDEARGKDGQGQLEPDGHGTRIGRAPGRSQGRPRPLGR